MLPFPGRESPRLILHVTRVGTHAMAICCGRSDAATSADEGIRVVTTAPSGPEEFLEVLADNSAMRAPRRALEREEAAGLAVMLPQHAAV